MELQPLGAVYQVNELGEIENAGSIANLKGEWKEAVGVLVSLYIEKLGLDLHSIYLRGSLAGGTPLPGISDIDSVYCTNGRFLSKEEEQNMREQLMKEYDVLQGVELIGFAKTDFDTENKPGIVKLLQTKGVCIYGEDVLDGLPRLHISQAYFHLPGLSQSLTHLEQMKKDGRFLTEKHIPWICKRILRSGLELVMEREGAFTRDLWYCWEIFSKYYPEKSEDMRRILELAVQPSLLIASDSIIVGNMGKRLSEEYMVLYA